ncbi:hypothetical protein LCGC14_2801460 [marine sediment metagenome]|uniref:Uncharacterized protein n=1 Tax=marine sediment metagenome TaxID=412755 RepID=A0A0F9BDZ0_9ZZZZ
MSKIATYPVIAVTDEGPTFSQPLSSILSRLQVGGAIRTLGPVEHVTDRQRAWYRGICLLRLSDWNGDTVDEWDLRLKAECNGVELLKSEKIYLGVGMTCTRLTIVGVGVRNMTQFIENVLSKGIEMNWPISAPDKELRR